VRPGQVSPGRTGPASWASTTACVIADGVWG
jgi:hypothetical protein